MKIIFLQDVPRVGRKHEIKDISSGYARNFLVPQKLAAIATKNNEKMIAEIRKREEVKKAEQEKELQSAIEKVEGKTIQFFEKASESGSLFAGIGRDEIAIKITEEAGTTLYSENILLEKPIKELGEFQVSVGTKEDNREITVKVEREEG